jgi:hypothetical protein
MKKLKLFLVALSLTWTWLLAITTNAAAQFRPAETFYAAGSSGQFSTFALAAGYPIFAGGPLCGNHRWTQSPSAANPIALLDPRNGAIPPEQGDIWIVWNDNAQNLQPGGAVCFYVSLESAAGVRCYQAKCTLSLSPGLVGVPDQGVVPLLGFSGGGGLPEPLPPSIFNIVNGAAINVGVTDIRPEDAKFATMRSLTPYAVQVTGRSVTGHGYKNPTGAPCPGVQIQSSQTNKVATPVDFAIDPGDFDPCSDGQFPVRRYVELAVGSAPVLIVANQQNNAAGSLGSGNYTNINREVLGRFLNGDYCHIRDINNLVLGEPDNPIHTFIREDLSGAYNVTEWSVVDTWENGEDPKFTPGIVYGQDKHINLALPPCGVKPCTVESANPLWHIFPQCGPAGGGIHATRGRVIGTNEMTTTVDSTADGLGYALWSYSNFQNHTTLGPAGHLKYLAVDSVDPLYAAPNLNPNGVGVLPNCTVNAAGQATNCPLLKFPNISNGTYAIWNKLRLIYDSGDPTNIAMAMVNYSRQASDPVTGVITDLVPQPFMLTFHSHYGQVVRDSGIAYGPNNGYKAFVPETGGDQGGLVFTIQSELDWINDTGGLQQVDFKQ